VEFLDCGGHAVSEPPGHVVRKGDGSTVAVADPPLVLTLEGEEVREAYVQVITVDGRERVVTGIDLLSPANKAAKSTGRSKYRAKQQKVLKGSAHLLEIDLLRHGQHTLLAPADALLQQAQFDYLVSLSRAGSRDRCEAWPITLRQRLPKIFVPLLDDDPGVVLNLQEVFERCYDEVGFARRIDYRRKPAPPLSRIDDEWAKELLRQYGIKGEET
jgi:hypothetical protein